MDNGCRWQLEVHFVLRILCATLAKLCKVWIIRHTLFKSAFWTSSPLLVLWYVFFLLSFFFRLCLSCANEWTTCRYLLSAHTIWCDSQSFCIACVCIEPWTQRSENNNNNDSNFHYAHTVAELLLTLLILRQLNNKTHAWIECAQRNDMSHALAHRF